MNAQDQKNFKKLEEMLEHTLIAVRDSVSPSYSEVTLKLTEKVERHMENHTRDMNEVRERFKGVEESIKTESAKNEPVRAAFAKANGFQAVVKVIFATFLTVATSIIAYKNLFK